MPVICISDLRENAQIKEESIPNVKMGIEKIKQSINQKMISFRVNETGDEVVLEFENGEEIKFWGIGLCLIIDD